MNESADGVALPPDQPVGHVKSWYRRAFLALLLVNIFGLVVFMAMRHSAPAGGGPGGDPAGRGGQNPPIAVAVATVTPGDIQVRIPAIGTVTTLANVTVRTQISGTLQKILFTEGQLVHEGDVVAQIDPRPYQAALQTAQGNLRRDQALLADARLDLTRYEALVKEDSIAVQQLDTQRALVDQYIGTIQSDEGQVKTAEVNLAYTRIVSPVSGRIGIRQVDQGNYVTPGDANGIVVVNQLQPISVLFNIPEDNVTALMKKLREGAAMTVEAYDRASTVKLADGTLATADNEIDTTTGTVKLRAQFANADGSLFPNQFVNVSLLMDLLQNQLVVPTAAVRRGAPNGTVGTFLFVVNADRTVSVRPVTLGVVDGERAAVSSGVAAGDVVVTQGADRLRDGAKVLLPDSAAGAAARGAAAGGPQKGAPPPGGKSGTHHWKKADSQQ
jgi:multidrug efflux system membrane fusion protein